MPTDISTAISAVESRLSDQEKALERRIGEARFIAKKRADLKQEISDLDATVLSLEEAIAVLNSYADTRQTELQRRIETLLTHGLQTIFGEEMSFKIKQSQKGKYMTADFVVLSKVGDQTIETSVLDARGGGVAAVAGFLLRLIILLLKQDSPAVLFLDETFAQLSAEYEPRLSEFIKELVEKTQVQIVMVTHSTAYSDHADRIYRFNLDGGITQITEES